MWNVWMLNILANNLGFKLLISSLIYKQQFVTYILQY